MVEGQPAGEGPGEKSHYGRYCSSPMKFVEREGLETDSLIEAPPVAAAHQARGLFYRPRRPYSYYVLSRQNRHVQGLWKLAHTATVSLENRSPILLVGADRTFFARRRTKLTFDSGALSDVEIDKTSELLGMVEVPLYLAQNIAAVPSALIKVDIDQTVAQTQIIGAELAIIQKQNDAQEIHKRIRALQDARTGGTP